MHWSNYCSHRVRLISRVLSAVKHMFNQLQFLLKRYEPLNEMRQRESELVAAQDRHKKSDTSAFKRLLHERPDPMRRTRYAPSLSLTVVAAGTPALLLRMTVRIIGHSPFLRPRRVQLCARSAGAVILRFRCVLL
jgi:hypothetical protein